MEDSAAKSVAAVNELREKLAEYRGALEAEKHLPLPINDLQATNNNSIRREAAEARRELRAAVDGASKAVADPGTPAEVSAEYEALLKDPVTQQIFRDASE